ncbi:bifunctional pyr operon transcriptional regulator/uracil phosphoribosyltransferase PyrR [Thermodesulfatator autotrophicus]|uniref:Bifunctional protein PyrR n=1 Tax=Thermodesulfatator autotrophicus TaxID=1795632 RepID=A0A177E808_9BACT|nr:bifunctional pyr operon transcriptional regulator/uracil phosphoribosyltransferase PyrR [Thermodesulfatator autotrophicus]OAG28084.1 transcriptional regulator [Thermodesulfatator autotrophicus]
MTERFLMGEKEIDRALTRIAHQILERNHGCKDLVLVGIRTGGVPLAERLKQKIKQIEGIEPPVGVLDITLYRDDWSRASSQPLVRQTQIPFPIDDKVVVLVDDVIYTGRTIRAALDALVDFGRPRKVELAVLVDRGHRELPIEPTYTGFTISTLPDEHVTVRLKEISGKDEVVLERH